MMFHAHLVVEDILPSAASRSQYRFYEIVAGRAGRAEHISGHKATRDANVTCETRRSHPVGRPGPPSPGLTEWERPSSAARPGAATRRSWRRPRRGRTPG